MSGRRKIAGWSEAGQDVYVYCDNDAKVRAPYDAMGLMQRLGLNGDRRVRDSVRRDSLRRRRGACRAPTRSGSTRMTALIGTEDEDQVAALLRRHHGRRAAVTGRDGRRSSVRWARCWPGGRSPRRPPRCCRCGITSTSTPASWPPSRSCGPAACAAPWRPTSIRSGPRTCGRTSATTRCSTTSSTPATWEWPSPIRRTSPRRLAGWHRARPHPASRRQRRQRGGREGGRPGRRAVRVRRRTDRAGPDPGAVRRSAVREPLAYPKELTYPCCRQALGELGEVSPREGPVAKSTRSGRGR